MIPIIIFNPLSGKFDYVYSYSGDFVPYVGATANVDLGIYNLTAANLIITSGNDIRPSADSTTALNIAQANGTNFVTFDTTNKRVGIGATTAPGGAMELFTTGNNHLILRVAAGYSWSIYRRLSDGALVFYDQNQNADRFLLTIGGDISLTGGMHFQPSANSTTAINFANACNSTNALLKSTTIYIKLPIFIK